MAWKYDDDCYGYGPVKTEEHVLFECYRYGEERVRWRGVKKRKDSKSVKVSVF